MSSRKVVYTAQSKSHFYCRDAVCEFVFSQGAIPLHPFRMFDYFLSDRVDRDLVRQANQLVLTRCDELWVFGEVIADGVLHEIAQASQEGKPIRYFNIDNGCAGIHAISPQELKFEGEVYEDTKLSRETLISFVNGGLGGRIASALGRSFTTA